MESATAFETALAVQRAPIAKEARESDTLLLVDFMVKDSVNRVQQFSTTKMKDEGIAALSRPTPAGVWQPSGGPGAQVAQRTFAAQNSANVTIVKVQGSSITSMLPAGVPVIDHLAAWASITPGWSTLTPAIEDLRKRRTPSLDPAHHPEVLELSLGTASAEEYAKISPLWAVLFRRRKPLKKRGHLTLISKGRCKKPAL
jgi:hypothetical protein